MRKKIRIVVEFEVVEEEWKIIEEGIKKGMIGVKKVDKILEGLWILGGECEVGDEYKEKLKRIVEIIMIGGEGIIK